MTDHCRTALRCCFDPRSQTVLLNFGLHSLVSHTATTPPYQVNSLLAEADILYTLSYMDVKQHRL
jgi:hypothetical protein